MTYLEKVMQAHPDMTRSEVIDEWCPEDFSLEEAGARECDGKCMECWNRKMPDTSDIEDSITPRQIETLKKEMGWDDPKGEKGAIGDPGPKILDSGNRREFETGAVRDIQEGKGRCDLLPLDVVAEYLGNEILAFISKFVDTGDVGFLFDCLHEFQADEYGKSGTMFLEVAKHFEEGCKKYGENNWQKGIPVHCYIDSAVRHYLKYLRGDKDEPHNRAFCWNLMCAIWTCKHKPELNDYAKNG